MSRIRPNGAAPLNQNLQNTVGRNTSESVAAQGTQTEKNILPAGASQYFPMTGEFFYVEASSGQINIAPNCAYGKGPENPYGTGTGLRVDRINAFTGLQIRNPNPDEPVFFQLKCGFDSFIDNRFISTDFLFSQVIKKTYSIFHDLPTKIVTITDLSGTIITDNNGNQWYAVNRQLLCLFNSSSDDYWFLQNSGQTTEEGLVHPLQSIQLPIGGDFKVIQNHATIGDTDVNGVVSEIYNCLPKLGLV